jgi:3-methyladenine DNA glycosylase AlkD
LNPVSQQIQILSDRLAAKRDDHFAGRMSAYMKNRFVYFGIMAEDRKAIQKVWLSEMKTNIAKNEYWDLLVALWDKDEREFQYIGIDWLNSWKKEELQLLDTAKFEWLLTQKSWWDSVDALASNVVGKYYKHFPEQKAQMVDDFRTSENLWLERTTLIFQLKYKETIDMNLLESLIIQYQRYNEFFIQKAIGWSLRQHAKIDALAVKNIVEKHNIQGLAKREALKHFDNYGISKSV